MRKKNHNVVFSCISIVCRISLKEQKNIKNRLSDLSDAIAKLIELKKKKNKQKGFKLNMQLFIKKHLYMEMK